MRVGFFTDTYFPQVSGVATSIKTLRKELEKNGHDVYIFTTTDPHVQDEESNIIRMPSIPFISFKDRRIAVSGMLDAYLQAKYLRLDIIHTHTEFGVGWLGKFVGKRLDIPVVHTYHTMYEDYLHYIAKGKLIRPIHVKQVSRSFCKNLSGIICPGQRVVDTLDGYGIAVPKEIIPTGVDLAKFKEYPKEKVAAIQKQYGISEKDTVLLSLSRISYEKNIQGILQGLPEIVKKYPHTKLLIVGGGPYLEELKKQTIQLELMKHVVFTGEIPNTDIAAFYHSGDYFVSLSSSESQGLTYIEALAAGTRCVVKKNPYLTSLLSSPSLGITVAQDEDFAATFIQYAAAPPEKNNLLRKEKLFEISSEGFGKKIEEFYLRAINYYQSSWFDDENDKEKQSLRIKIFRR